nr:hypothetical protein [Thiocapsa roseopersicina]
MNELLQFRSLQEVAQLGLAQEHQLQYEILVRVDIRKQSKLFELVESKILSFIDDEQHALAGSVLIDQEVDECLMKIALRACRCLDVECLADPVHQVAERLMRMRDQADRDIPIKPIQEVAHQGGLAGADFSGEDDEACLVEQSVLKQGQRFLVFLAQVQEAGIRKKGEGFLAKFKKGFVHLQGPLETRRPLVGEGRAASRRLF